MEITGNKDYIVDDAVIKYEQNRMYLQNLSFQELRQLQNATEQYILQHEQTDKMSQILSLNQKAKQRIQILRRQKQKVSKQQQFQKTHSSIVDDIIEIVSKIGPESPIGDKKPLISESCE